MKKLGKFKAFAGSRPAIGELAHDRRPIGDWARQWAGALIRRLAVPVVSLAVLAGMGASTLTLLVGPDKSPAASIADDSAPEGASAVDAIETAAGVRRNKPPVSGPALTAHTNRSTKSDRLSQASPPPEDMAIDAPAERDEVTGEGADHAAQASDPEPSGSVAPIDTNAAEQRPFPHPEPASEVATVDTKAAATASEPVPPTRSAPVTKDVRLRAGPENDAAVIAVVPAGSPVGVIECDYWCEVTFAGKRGWIYRSFVRGTDS